MITPKCGTMERCFISKSISYSVFHDVNDQVREKNVVNIKKEMSKAFLYLSSETYMVNSNAEANQKIIDVFGFKKNDIGADMRLGGIGLLLGTIALYKKALSQSIDNLIVFEDDFVIEKNASNVIKKILKFKNSFDAISLDNHYSHWHKYDSRSHELGDSIICKTYNVFGTQAYIISKRGMLKVIEHVNSNELRPIDLLLWDRSIIEDLQSFSIKPDLPVKIGCVLTIDKNGESIAGASTISTSPYYFELMESG